MVFLDAFAVTEQAPRMTEELSLEDFVQRLEVRIAALELALKTSLSALTGPEALKVLRERSLEGFDDAALSSPGREDYLKQVRAELADLLADE